MVKSRRKAAPRDLREECLREALAIIEDSGVESLSLREVARRLGGSHQAPYKHFASRDHILAEIVGRAFVAFAAFLDARPQTGVPVQDMGAMGRAYLGYATDHPLSYRLMFGGMLPDPSKHPEMMERARHAFSLLQTDIQRVHAAAGRSVTAEQVNQDALFVWATLHGLATILDGATIHTLGLSKRSLNAAPAQTLERIGQALGVSAER